MALTLKNETLELTFNERTGSLIGLSALATGWRVLKDPGLGLSWRLLVPLRADADWHTPGARNNPVHGESQAFSRCGLDEDGLGVVFEWDQVIDSRAQPLPIRVLVGVRLAGDRAVFSLRVANHSAHIVESVYYPTLGGVTPPPGEEAFTLFRVEYSAGRETRLWPHFDNNVGYFGNDYPAQFFNSQSAGAPMVPFVLLRGARQGLFAGVLAPEYELVAWHAELRPGYASSMEARAPGGEAIAGHAVDLRFAAVHMPYIQPGETRELTSVALAPYQGGWQQGADLYKAWRAAWMTPAAPPDWINGPHAWQQVHINSPEDELRVRFSDLAVIGEHCARHGVKAIQLVGWNDGGQDQGNPSHDPDPRLGTFAELKEAIARIQDMGVQVILFTKFTWADRATARFQRELIRHAVKDPYGDYYHYGGYLYQTATQLLNINAKRLVPMCFLSQEYLDLCAAEFQKVLDLGAAGMLYDECQHHSPALLCFDPHHGHRPGALVYANDNRLVEIFKRIAPPSFLFAGEACYDWQFGAYQLSYHRSENAQHIPAQRYLLPEAQIMTALTGFNDRNMANQCLLYRYIISYEPFNFKGHLEDFPETLAYGKQVDALRADLRDYFWDGEFRHTCGASVMAGDQPHHPYAVFTRRCNGLSALAVANYSLDRAVTVTTALDNGQALSRYRLVDDPIWKDARAGIHIPPQSAAVVLPDAPKNLSVRPEVLT